MFNKHFIKTLVLFTVMIILGLIGIFLVGHFSSDTSKPDSIGSKTQVAK